MALKNQIVDDPDAIVKQLLQTQIELVYSEGITKVLLDGEDVTDPLRSKIVNDNVSFISKIKDVRKELVRRQKKMGEAGGVVMEGRDIGTVVFPHAQLKIFLIANLETRAERRLHEVKKKGAQTTFTDIKQNLLSRDTIDSSREVDPLTKAADAFTVDTTELTIDQQVDFIYGLALKLLNQP
jgi:cytidylate kinase